MADVAHSICYNDPQAAPAKVVHDNGDTFVHDYGLHVYPWASEPLGTQQVNILVFISPFPV